MANIDNIVRRIKSNHDEVTIEYVNDTYLTYVNIKGIYESYCQVSYCKENNMCDMLLTVIKSKDGCYNNDLYWLSKRTDDWLYGKIIDVISTKC